MTYRHPDTKARDLALRELEYARDAKNNAERRLNAAARAALDAGATQADVAQVLGVTRQAVSKRRNAAWGALS